jgi:hypothetical protein
VFPEQLASLGFSCYASIDDDRTQAVLKVLEDAGLTPWDSTKGQPRVRDSEYNLRYERLYDAADLAICKYLQILPPSKAFHLEVNKRTESGQIILPKRGMPRGFDIMLAHSRIAYFATERAKSAIEGVGLQHVIFRPTCYGPTRLQEGETEESIAARYGRSYWELDSDFTLPNLSHTIKLTDFDGQLWERGDFSNGLIPREGLFLYPELHYRRSDLENLAPFDLARTYEPFGNYSGYDRQNCPLIASRRFYETCVANKLKTGWVPVRIDPE